MPTYRIHHRIDAYDVYDIEAATPAEAIQMLRDGDQARDGVIAEVELGRIESAPVNVDTIAGVNVITSHGPVDITDGARLGFLMLNRAPENGRVVTRHKDPARHMVLDMVGTLMAADHPNVLDRIADFTKDSEYPATALMNINDNDTIWTSNETRDLLLTLHDMLNEVAPEGTYFGMRPGSTVFGFWEVQNQR